MNDIGKFKAVLAISTFLATVGAAEADITVGFITSLSGPASSQGVQYQKGMAAAQAYKADIDGVNIRVVQLDDGSDPSISARNARKLVEDEKVDVLIGTGSAQATQAISTVATELKVPMIAIAPLPNTPVPPDQQWSVTVVAPPSLLVKVVTDRMKRDGVKSTAFIGFADAWGDFVYEGAKAAEERGDVKVVTNERYARNDTSVTGQILRIISTKPDAVLDGGAATQGALPLLALADRNFKGSLYGTLALVNNDFIRVGGKAAEGIQVSANPSIVAEQLPDDHYGKNLALKFRDAYQKANGSLNLDGFSASSFDAWILLINAAKRTMTTLKPGSPGFRQALRDELLATKGVIGVNGIYNFKPGTYAGVDERSLVIVRLTDGKWKYVP